MSGGRPTPPTPIDAPAAEVTDRLAGRRVAVPDRLVEQLAATGAVVRRDDEVLADAGRDWWPMAIAWAARGQVAARPALVVRPADADQVAEVLARCSAAAVPVTPMAGRSGVCGGAVALHGGIALDLTGLLGPVVLDGTSLVADVPAGVFGPELEAALRAEGEGYTLGHWPQSMALSTVGGWLACRSAGQYSTRYGKIEDMVIGLEVVLADGRRLRTEGAAPRAATGPNLTQVFVGSEGTLGVVTSARLRVHPAPLAETRGAWGFGSFAAGLEACRRILRRGATPAVLRLYDEVESQRNFGQRGTCVLIVLDEGDPTLVAATRAVTEKECAPADHLDEALVGRWLEHRNDVTALAPLWRAGVVVDTVEVAGRWSVLPALAHDVLGDLQAVTGTLSASVHQSHAYPDGACLYFTFAGQEPGADRAGDTSNGLDWQETYYRRAWEVVTARTLAHGAAISHHHGIGINRARFLPAALGAGFEVLASLKAALDPAGILNPGKLGLPSPFGKVPWP